MVSLYPGSKLFAVERTASSMGRGTPRSNRIIKMIPEVAEIERVTGDLMPTSTNEDQDTCTMLCIAGINNLSHPSPFTAEDLRSSRSRRRCVQLRHAEEDNTYTKNTRKRN